MRNTESYEAKKHEVVDLLNVYVNFSNRVKEQSCSVEDKGYYQKMLCDIVDWVVGVRIEAVPLPFICECCGWNADNKEDLKRHGESEHCKVAHRRL